MKKYLYVAVAALVALSSCEKKNEPVAPVDNTNAPVFTATIEGDANDASADAAASAPAGGPRKTQITTGSAAGKMKVEWLSSDEVFIYGLNPTGVVSVVGDYNVSPNATDATSATLNPGSSLNLKL